jgi:hypothetical protein
MGCLIRSSPAQANGVVAVPLSLREMHCWGRGGFKIVVGMQHPATTFCEMVNTPKKSADACLFCFPG